MAEVPENVALARNTLFLQMRSVKCRLVSGRKIHEKKIKEAPPVDGKAPARKEYTRTELTDGYNYLKMNLPDEDEPLAQIEWLSRERLVADENSPIFGWPTSMLTEATSVVDAPEKIIAVDIYRHVYVISID